jgi:hypothetical protein
VALGASAPPAEQVVLQRGQVGGRAAATQAEARPRVLARRMGFRVMGRQSRRHSR